MAVSDGSTAGCWLGSTDIFDFARHENPDSWSDLLTLLKF
jgi:hypothetical protein